MPNQPWEEERGACFHDEATTRKYKADFGVAIGNSDVHGQCHCNTDSNGGALESTDGRLAAMEDRQSYPATSIYHVSIS